MIEKVFISVKSVFDDIFIMPYNNGMDAFEIVSEFCNYGRWIDVKFIKSFQ